MNVNLPFKLWHIVIVSVLLLAMTGGPSQAQEPPPPEPHSQPAAPQSTEATAANINADITFTYQGQLKVGENAYTGSCDFRFAFYDSETGGSSVHSDIRSTVPVTNGLFTTQLDYGFGGPQRWIEIGVSCPHSAAPSYTTLSPRQRVTGAPYAISLMPDARVTFYDTASTSLSAAKLASSGFAGLAGYGYYTNTYGVYGSASGNRGIGVYGQSTSTSGRGIYGTAPTTGTVGIATAASGATYGVYGQSNSSSGYGVYGTAPVYGVYGLSNAFGVYGQSDSVSGKGVYGYASASSGVTYGVHGHSDSPSGTGVRGSNSANGGIGVSGTGERIGVHGLSWATDGQGIYAYALGRGVYATSIGTDGYGVYAEATGKNGTGIYAIGGSSGYAADFQGNVILRSRSTGSTIMELGEGLDYAEGFDVSDKTGIVSGAVLVIDPDHPGKLTTSSKPYDTRVAGIVAGAKGLNSGVRLGVDQFDYNVALAGRVYCNVDATEAAVEPGDLLTTSSTPGYAMRAMDYARAQGATLGKAMERLEKGRRGLILVLVTLQ